MRPQKHFTVALAVVFLSASFAYYNYGIKPSNNDGAISSMKVLHYEVVPIENAVGPESFAFDANGGGPYTGVSDGRIIKWHPLEKRWRNFATTYSHRNDQCGGPYNKHLKTEHICGRPLGLCFSNITGDLYIADAYKGLIIVGPNGGTATTVSSHIEGSPFGFTNSVDIDQQTGTVYFTSSSSKYERRNYVSLILSKDKTGKLMKYDPQSKQVSLLLNNLSFANGVALSKNSDYILIAETNNCRVLRYWLQTPKAGTLEVFANLPGFPDNIKRSPRGGFWVGIYSRRDKFVQWILSYPWIGRTLLKLPLDITKVYSYLAKLKGSSGLAIRLSDEGNVLEIVESGTKGRSISDVEERDGVLWVGSIETPFAGKYHILGAQG
ncbi:hypothetical protein TanjilG_26863 [Lupinus angustifolius]|uniref:Strictosidine synthase conserved region domain-containing protein n=1 Tax=Lupinus angustifolius TaxID=3871 RepID=A0A4P1RJD2_LUPAN|nr:PREDICTED: protein STRICTOSIDINE SYNTHASE-LIKE 2-like [Lupinus angustifolius]OIW11497.1 hypothetical protein TanjilG_26863 [Lupinus angustifolius]